MGALHSPAPGAPHLGGLTLVAALVTAALIQVSPLVGIAGLLFVTGLASSPLLVTAYPTADDLVPERQQREASTWPNTVCNLGAAVGASAGGVLADQHGAGGALTFGAAAYAVTLLVVLFFGHRLGPSGTLS